MKASVFALADEDCTTSQVKGETAPNTLALFMWMSEGETGTLYQCSQKTRKNVIFLRRSDSPWNLLRNEKATF